MIQQTTTIPFGGIMIEQGVFLEHAETHHNVDNELPSLMNSNGRFNLRELYQWLSTDLPDRLKEEKEKPYPNEKRVAYLKTTIAQLNK